MLLIMVSKLCTKFDICPPLLSTVASDIEEGAKCVAYGDEGDEDAIVLECPYNYM